MLALNGKHDLVAMPLVPALLPTLTQFIGICLAKLQRPFADRLLRDNGAETGHQFLNVAKTQRKPEVEPHHVADDFRWIAQPAVNLGFFIPLL